MAGKPWTDQCKIDACIQIDKRAEEVGEIKKAMLKLASESGIPFGTLNRWYYQKDDEGPYPTHGVQKSSKTHAKTKARVISKIVDNYKKAQDKDITESKAQASFEGAEKLAGELGGKVIREELYEMFLKAVSKVDDIIRANKEMKEPVDTDNMVNTLLRMARNAGWIEPVVEEPEPTSEGAYCKKCDIVVKGCANRTCEFHKPKKKGAENASGKK